MIEKGVPAMPRPRIRTAPRSVRASLTALVVLVATAIPAGGISSALASGAANGTTWPTFHGTLDNRGFNKHESVVGRDNVSSLSIDWFGNGATQGEDLVFMSSPVVSQGLVFFGTSIGQVLAFPQHGCGDSECEPVWRARLPQGVYSTPAVSHGILYVGTPGDVGALYAFKAKGCGQFFCQPLWSAKVNAGESAPKVMNGVVYIGGEKGLVAFDANGCGGPTCTPLWTGLTGDVVFDSPAISNGVAYVGSQDGRLYAFDASGCGQKQCQPLWYGQTGSAIYASSPAVAGGFVYVGSFADGRLNVFKADGCGKSACDPVWKGDADQYVDSSPAVAYGRVYIGTGHAELRVFDAAGCGRKLCQPEWIGTAAGPMATMDGAPMVANGVVYVGENNQRVYAFAAKGCGSPGCEPLWEFITQDPIVNTSPAIIDGTLYLTGSNFGAVPILYVFTLAG
jgi:outer membrane protein assembly factor BamB